MQKIRLLVQLLFLGVFITLMVLGKAQFWMAFIFASILMALFFGRFYCGWACPINTLIRPVNWLGKKLGWQRQTPSFLKSGRPRAVIFVIFLGALAYTIYTITQGKKFPLPLIIIPFGLLVTLFINPTAWHRYLCPWGTFFSFTGRHSHYGIKSGACISCKACATVCPTESVSHHAKYAQVDPTNCLLCLNCVNSCNKKALSYKWRKVKKDSGSCYT